MSMTTTSPTPVLRLVRSRKAEPGVRSRKGPPATRSRIQPAPRSMLDRAEFRLMRRRRLTTLAPGILAAVAAAVAVIADRHTQRLGGAAFARHALDHALVLVWVGFLVVMPLAASVKPRPMRAGALAAVLSGPVLMPLVFGTGWRWWQAMAIVVAAATALVPKRPLLGR